MTTCTHTRERDVQTRVGSAAPSARTPARRPAAATCWLGAGWAMGLVLAKWVLVTETGAAAVRSLRRHGSSTTTAAACVAVAAALAMLGVLVLARV